MDRKQEVLSKLMNLFEDLLCHEGYGSLRVDMRILKRGQKEVVIDCGKQYRFVVDYRPVHGSRRQAPGDVVSRDPAERSVVT